MIDPYALVKGFLETAAAAATNDDERQQLAQAAHDFADLIDGVADEEACGWCTRPVDENAVEGDDEGMVFCSQSCADRARSAG